MSEQTVNDERRTTNDEPADSSRLGIGGAAPRVSIIVVTYNSAAHLPPFFAALAATEYDAYEVIVVDNASQDTTLRVLDGYRADITLLANAANIGFGRACNAGARVAQGELLVFMNADVLVTPGWLATLVRHLAAQPDAGIICPTTQSGDRRQGTGDRGQEDYAVTPSSCHLVTSSSCHPVTLAPVEEVATVPGCALMIRRATWQQIGGFDEQIFLYWEDTDLCWRAWLRGWRVLADREALIYHERGGSGGGNTWDAERLRHGLYTYIKLMRWRRVLPFALRQAAGTLVKLARGRGRGLLASWAWVLRRGGLLLAARRELGRTRRGDPAALERLVDAHTRRMHAAYSAAAPAPLSAAPCPLCGATRRTRLFDGRDRSSQLPGAFMIVQCVCGLRATLPPLARPADYYPADYYAYQPPVMPALERGWKGGLRVVALRYHDGYAYGALGRRLPASGAIAAALRCASRPFRARARRAFGPGPLPQARAGGRALDIGCGSGTWLLKMRALGWDVTGVEPSQRAGAAARAVGLRVYQEPLGAAPLAPASFDVVRLWHVLEHVEDPAALMSQALRLLVPGGQLIVGVPNAAGGLARLAKTYWFDLDVPRHRWHFDQHTLTRLVTQAGGSGVLARTSASHSYASLRTLQYLVEQKRGYTRAGRSQFEQRLAWLRRAALAWPLRQILRASEATNHIELVAQRPREAR